MRFCPFCAHENLDEALACTECSRRLPPARRAADALRSTILGAGPSSNPPGTAVAASGTDPGARTPSVPPATDAAARLSGGKVPEPLPNGAASASSSSSGPPVYLAPPADKANLPVAETKLGMAPVKLAGPPVQVDADRNRVGKFSETLMLDKVRHDAAPAPAKAPMKSVQLELPTPEPSAPTWDASGPNINTGAVDAPSAASSDSSAYASTALQMPVQSESAGFGVDPAHAPAHADEEWTAPPPGAWGRIRQAVDMGAVAYLFSSAGDALRKRREISALSAQIVSEEEQFGPVLLALGRQARAADLATPPVLDEMSAVKQLENERRQTEERAAELEQQRATEERQFQLSDETLSQRLAAAEEVVAKLTEALEVNVRERSGYQAAISRIDVQLKSLAKQVGNVDAAMLRQKDAGEIAKLQGEAQAVRVQIAALEPERERFGLKSSALDQPISDLEIRLAAARDDVEKLRGEQDATRAAHARREAEFQNEIAAGRTRSSDLEREISLKLATVGTILNLNRVPGPAFDPLYAQFDTIKQRVTSCESDVSSLQTALQSYDRARIHKGMKVLGASIVLVGLLVSLAVWLL